MEDPFLINGFNVNILSATIDPSSRSRNNSEQDKMRLIRKLCMDADQSNTALEDFYKHGNNDIGIKLNSTNPLKSISYLKSIERREQHDSNDQVEADKLEIGQTYNMTPG